MEWPDEIIAPVTSEDLSRAALPLDLEDAFDPATLEDASVRVSRTIAARQGQPQFRAACLSAYGGKCAVTGCAIPELLEATHFVPYLGEGSNDIRNGLLLRADIHTLFDLSFLTIDPDSWTVEIAETLIGSEYATLAGTRIRLPSNRLSWPSAEALRTRASAS